MTLQGKIFPVKFTLPIEDPFILVAHHYDAYPEGNLEMEPKVRPENWIPGDDMRSDRGYKMYYGEHIPGFPSHPHRGFETITYARRGMIDHFDSLGNSGRYGDGDVQWMTSGRGIQHAEMFPLLNTEEANPFEIVQIWFNLPKKHKMVEPIYKMIWNETIPVIETEDKLGTVKILIGKYFDTTASPINENSWAADPNNHVNIWEVNLKAGASFKIPMIPDNIPVQLYVMKGALKVEEYEIQSSHLLRYTSKDDVTFEALDETTLMVFIGRPIGEPMAAYGPFVMNTDAEIRQAYLDFQETEFGGWPWPQSDPKIDRNLGRFSKFDGGTRTEYPPKK